VCDPFIVVVHSYGKHAFSIILTDNILIQSAVNLLGGEWWPVGGSSCRSRPWSFTFEDVPTKVDTLIADENAFGSSDQALDLAFIPIAE